MSEFPEIRAIPAQAPSPKNAMLISTPSMGHIASEGFKTIGEHRSPVQEGLAAEHPGMAGGGLPEPMLDAVRFSALNSPEYVSKCRPENLREFVAKAKELSCEEKTLKDSFSDRRREILSPKRLLLFKWLLDRS